MNLNFSCRNNMAEGEVENHEPERRKKSVDYIFQGKDKIESKRDYDCA